MVMAWISAVTGIAQSGDIFSWLHNGTVLVALANKLSGKSIKANDSTMPFKQMENISNFLKSCREDLHMKENDLFTTADLYDQKSKVNCINGLIATSRAATKAGFKGPTIAPKESGGGDSKKWDISNPNATTSMLSMGSAGIMERSSVDISRNVTFGADHAGTGSGEASKLNMGSAGIMERDKVSNSRNIDFGAKAGKS